MKPCIICNITKPISEYYAHPRMADGHLGKCKECCKAQAEQRRVEKMQDSQWVAAELERQRLKTLRRPKAVTTLEQRREYQLRYQAKHPDKRKAQTTLGNALRDGKITRQLCHCGRKGEAHHSDYSKPLDVTWLCRTHHAELHRKPRP